MESRGSQVGQKNHTANQLIDQKQLLCNAGNQSEIMNVIEQVVLCMEIASGDVA